jgi:hypothetical protein
MGHYDELYERQWLDRWVSDDDIPEEITPYQYRYILAKKREAEHERNIYRDAIGALKKAMKLY